jgi:hypothetical protein
VWSEWRRRHERDDTISDEAMSFAETSGEASQGGGKSRQNDGGACFTKETTDNGANGVTSGRRVDTRKGSFSCASRKLHDQTSSEVQRTDSFERRNVSDNHVVGRVATTGALSILQEGPR